MESNPPSFKMDESSRSATLMTMTDESVALPKDGNPTATTLPAPAPLTETKQTMDFYTPAPKTIAIIQYKNLRPSRIKKLFSKKSKQNSISSLTTIPNNNKIHLIPFGFLPNNFVISMGFLEFGNASDFGANVFNARPVPKIGIIFMAIGGTFAILVSLIALTDLKRSIPNYKRLKQERIDILAAAAENSLKQDELRIESVVPPTNETQINEKSVSIEPGSNISPSNSDMMTVSSWDALLEVNTLDLRMELIKRIIASILLGTSCIIVGIGTFMAIGGNNKRVYFTSNLLSGYIGNFPALLYGIINSFWAFYLIKRTSNQSKIAKKVLGIELYKTCLLSRHRHMAYHGACDGFFSLLAGIASMITATRWWGYVILAPCVFLSLVWSYSLRHHVRYERNLFITQDQDIEGFSRTPNPIKVEFNGLIRDVLEGKQVKNEIMMYDIEKEGESSENISTKTLLEDILHNDLFTQLALMIANLPEGEGLRFFKLMKHEHHQKTFILTFDDLQSLEDGSEDEQFIRGLTIQCLSDNRNRLDPARQRYREELLGCSLLVLENHKIIPNLNEHNLS